MNTASGTGANGNGAFEGVIPGGHEMLPYGLVFTPPSKFKQALQYLDNKKSLMRAYA